MLSRQIPFPFPGWSQWSQARDPHVVPLLQGLGGWRCNLLGSLACHGGSVWADKRAMTWGRRVNIGSRTGSKVQRRELADRELGSGQFTWVPHACTRGATHEPAMLLLRALPDLWCAGKHVVPRPKLAQCSDSMNTDSTARAAVHVPPPWVACGVWWGHPALEHPGACQIARCLSSTHPDKCMLLGPSYHTVVELPAPDYCLLSGPAAQLAPLQAPGA